MYHYIYFKGEIRKNQHFLVEKNNNKKTKNKQKKTKNILTKAMQISGTSVHGWIFSILLNINGASCSKHH